MRLVTTDPAVELAARLDDLSGAIIAAARQSEALLRVKEPRPSGRGSLRLCV